MGQQYFNNGLAKLKQAEGEISRPGSSAFRVGCLIALAIAYFVAHIAERIDESFTSRIA